MSGDDMAFLFGQGLISDYLSGIAPETAREKMLLMALEAEHRALERIRFRGGPQIDMDAYDGIKDAETVILRWTRAENIDLDAIHKAAHALGNVEPSQHATCAERGAV